MTPAPAQLAALSRPLAIDLYCGLGGWAEGLMAAGYEVIGFDITQHVYGEHRYPAQLVLQDVLTLHGKQFANADLIVASPPCQEYSYMAMPWTRAKQMAKAIEDDETGEALRKLNERFDACLRIQREACAAAGKYVPMVIENVRGAQKWVGPARWRHGSYFLWGDTPALMPSVMRGFKSTGMNWNDRTRRGQDFTRIAREQALKHGGDWFRGGIRDPMASSSGTKRKMASALIAKIPFELASYIGRVYHPRSAA